LTHFRRRFDYVHYAHAATFEGSLQTKTCPDGTTTYDYDAFGNLRGVTQPDGTVITYIIDGQNRRVGKKVNGILVESFVYRSQLQPAVWLNADGSVRANFIYFSRPNAPDYMQSGGATYRLVADQAGTVRIVVNVASGAVVERIDYDEFGQLLADSNLRFQPFSLEGGLSDTALPAIRFGARDYDPLTGRWNAKDPLAFDGGLWNFYSFVGGDPNNRVDPDGLTTWVCEKPLDFLGGKNAPSSQRKSLPWISPTIFNDLFHHICALTLVV
jgi:RHS repeat-associated protein